MIAVLEIARQYDEEMKDILDDLQQAEFEYREMCDRHGHDSSAAKRVLDRLISSGNKARELLNRQVVPWV